MAQQTRTSFDRPDAGINVAMAYQWNIYHLLQKKDHLVKQLAMLREVAYAKSWRVTELELDQRSRTHENISRRFQFSMESGAAGIAFRRCKPPRSTNYPTSGGKHRARDWKAHFEGFHADIFVSFSLDEKISVDRNKAGLLPCNQHIIATATELHTHVKTCTGRAENTCPEMAYFDVPVKITASPLSNIFKACKVIFWGDGVIDLTKSDDGQDTATSSLLATPTRMQQRSVRKGNMNTEESKDEAETRTHGL
ncbi:hypothetical protein BC830DRAFT_1084578 [Chytriomyces sp. MP71]|nr:hypothetical protein BC830DRAFT_1084578 [Chytriomyces sp. MP71]